MREPRPRPRRTGAPHCAQRTGYRRPVAIALERVNLRSVGPGARAVLPRRAARARSVAALAVAIAIGIGGCAHDAPLSVLPGLARFETPEGVVGMPTIDGYRYIVPVDGGVVLVDAGFQAPTQSERDVVGGRRILAVLVTHAHLDHVGGLAAYDGIPVYIGRDELPVASHALDHRAPLQRFFRAIVPFAGLPHSVHAVDDGDVVVVGGRMFTALFLRGHTRGSTAWITKRVDDDADVWLFSGDAVLAHDGRIGFPPPGFSDDERQMLASLERLRGHPFRVMFDGHAGRSVGSWAKIPRFIVEETRRRF